MTFIPLLFLAIGLAMDATAVSAARGLAVSTVRPKHVLLVAVFFGGFQALMPLVGYLVGQQVGPFIAAWQHWVVFVLLGGIGGKMLWEARSDAERADGDEKRLFAIPVMLALAVATSIDALAAGFTLPMLGAPLVVSIATIGVTTAVLSAVGLYAGRRFGLLLGKRLDVLGGLVLIGLGVKALVEHFLA